MNATAVAERLFYQCFETELLEGVEANPDLNDWSIAGRNKVKSRPNGEDVVWWRIHGPTMVDDYIAWRKRSPWELWKTPDGVKAVELPIIVDMGGYDLVMHIDRVFRAPTGHLIIVDLKTGSRTPESDLQLGVYRYGLRKTYGLDAAYGAYYMARTGDVGELFQLSRYTNSLIEDMFGTYRKALEHRIFVPHVTFRCRACSMRDYCVAYGGSKANTIPTQSTGVAA